MKNYETSGRELVAEYPAYDVYTRKSYRGINVLKDGDNLILNTNSKSPRNNHIHKFQIGSVFGYAVENNDDPLVGYQRAIDNGHSIYYIFALGSCLTAHKQAKKEYYEVAVGEKVYFMGKYFEIEPAGNNNLHLKEIDAPEHGDYSDKMANVENK